MCEWFVTLHEIIVMFSDYFYEQEKISYIWLFFSIVYEEESLSQHAAPSYQNLIIQHMDIAEPLSTLKSLLELRLQCTLSDHQFYLQDTIEVQYVRKI